MNTLKYFSKTLVRYFLSLLGMFTLAILLFIIGFVYLFYNNFSRDTYPSQVQSMIIQDNQIDLSAEARKLLDDADIWAMVLDENGQVIDSENLPSSIPTQYKQADIARFTRWYIKDYPVFTYIAGDQLLVLGYPKDSYVRLDTTFETSVFTKLFYLLVTIAVLLLLIFFGFYLRSRLLLLREMTPITQALANLSENHPVQLDEKGNLSEIKSALNQTSQLLLETKDMRNHWIRGISHDLRNPLTLMLGAAHQLENRYGSQKETQQLQQQIEKMEEIISNLNMSYLLENQELEQDMTVFDMNALLRQLITDLYNQEIKGNLTFAIPERASWVRSNSSLLTRAIHNLVLNSLTHNQEPQINLQLLQEDKQLHLTIADDGSISPEKVQELQEKSRNVATHGMGTIITKQIISLHHGTIDYHYKNPGLEVRISLPAESSPRH